MQVWVSCNSFRQRMKWLGLFSHCLCITGYQCDDLLEGFFFLVLYIYEHQPIAITLFHGLNLIFRWFCDTIFICPKTKNSLKLTTVHNTFQTWIRNTSNLICLMLCSITSITMIEWRHYSSNFLNAVTKKKIPKVP